MAKMGVRGELFTNEIYLDNRSYFFNVKETRTGDIFLQVVESKNRDGADQDRHQIAVFAEDMQKFLQGLEKSLSFIEKEQKNRAKIKAEKKAAKIEKAKNLLQYSDYSIVEIANYFSFASQSHFIQTFQKYTGLTPRKYRDKHFRNNWENTFIK